MLYIQDRIDPSYTLIRRDTYVYPVIPGGLPTFDYVVKVTAPDSLTVANGGDLIETRPGSDGTTTWVYRSRAPSWRMDIAIAPMGVLQSGPVRIFYMREDSVGARGVNTAAEQCLDLYAHWFGPLENPGGLTFLEIPEGWGSQTDVVTIIQTADAFRDPTRYHEVYHEIAHLWHVEPKGEPSPRWNEGLASFLEYLTAERLDGRTGAVRERWREVQDRLADRLDRDSALASVPMRDYGRHRMSGYSYSVGMLMFAVLHDLVGEKAFNAGVGEFYRTYRLSGGTTEDFIRVMNGRSSHDLRQFFRDWIYTANWTDMIRAKEEMSDVAADDRWLFYARGVRSGARLLALGTWAVSARVLLAPPMPPRNRIAEAHAGPACGSLPLAWGRNR
jgi:hypothetical protein